MGLTVKFNPSQLEASIKNMAETAGKNASRTMRRAAIRIRDLAREYAPVKTGTLEKAIDFTTVQDSNRRNVFIVYIDLDMVNPGPAGHSVGDYVWIMEQQLRPYGNRGKPYHLGGRPKNGGAATGSVAKAASGKKVGGHFLTRAIKEGTKDLVANAATAVQRTLGGARMVDIAYQRDTGEDS